MKSAGKREGKEVKNFLLGLEHVRKTVKNNGVALGKKREKKEWKVGANRKKRPASLQMLAKKIHIDNYFLKSARHKSHSHGIINRLYAEKVKIPLSADTIGVSIARK